MLNPHLLHLSQTVTSQSSAHAQSTWRTLPAEVQQITTQLLAYLLKQVQIDGGPAEAVQEVLNDD